MNKNKTLKLTLCVLSAVLCVLLLYFSVAAVGFSRDVPELGFMQRLGYGIESLFTESTSDIAKRVRFTLTGKAENEFAVVSGDAVYPKLSGSFDHALDMAGGCNFTDEETQKIVKLLEDRKTAYAKDGAEYLLVIIPSVHSASGDSPFDKSGVTRLEALTEQLSILGRDYVIDATEILKDGDIPAFDNTSDTINSYGAYLLFSGIHGLMPEGVRSRSLDIGVTAEDYECIETDGGALAISLGLEKAIKNKTYIPKSGKMPERYERELAEATFYSLCLKPEYDKFIGYCDVVLDIPYNAERTLLTEYFSNAYPRTVYKFDHAYSPSVAETSVPSAVVQFIREDDLCTLLDPDIALTYERRLGGEQSSVTEAPSIFKLSQVSHGSVMIAGYCEQGASVTVKGGAADITVKSSYGLFIAQVEAGDGDHLTVYAEAEGKSVSEGVKISVKAAGGNARTAFLGSSSYLYYSETLADYTGGNLVAENELKKGKRYVENLIDQIRAASGKETKVIMLVAPNPLTVYPDIASSEHLSLRADYTRRDQIRELFDTGSLVLLDIVDYMKKYSDAGKLYYQTDTHWTDIGAFFGYTAILDEVAKDHPSAAPYPLSAFERVDMLSSGGDLSSFAGLGGLNENVSFLMPLYESRASGYPEKPLTINRPETAKAFVSHANGEGLPVAYMMRDSYSAQMIPHITEHFSTLYCEEMWKYTPDMDVIAELKPDYVIIVACERNLPVLF